MVSSSWFFTGLAASSMLSIVQDSPREQLSPHDFVLVDYKRVPCRVTEDFIPSFSLRAEVKQDLRRDDGTSCGDSAHEGVSLSVYNHQGPHGRYRVAYIKRAEASHKDFLIYLAGGPRWYVPGMEGVLSSSIPYGLSVASDRGVVTPEYMGSIFRSLYPGNDLGPATDEVIELMARLRQVRPNARISIVASSAGADIAMSVLRRVPVPVVLNSPLLASFHGITLDASGTDWWRTNFKGKQIFNRSRPEDNNGQWDQVIAPMLDAKKSFLGSAYYKDLVAKIDELPVAHRKCLRIVLGDADPRIKVSFLPKLRSKARDIPVTVVRSDRHELKTEDEVLKHSKLLVQTLPAKC